MRILVISDSHRRPKNIEKILREQPFAQDVYFLGDIIPDVEYVKKHFPDRCFRAVSGNCDFSSAFPEQAIDECGKIKIFYTHGHKLNVKYGTERLLSEAVKNNCQIALYGHTHIAVCEYRNGIYLINPGSCSRSRMGPESYAVIDIVNGEIIPAILKL